MPEVKNTQGTVLLTLEDGELQAHDFYKADLPNADFSGQTLERTRFYGANLKGARFEGSKLRWTNFQVANLEGANLRNADLAYAHLLGANLCGADLTGANLKWATIKGTKYNERTQFPQGFNPASYEFVKVTEATASAG